MMLRPHSNTADGYVWTNSNGTWVPQTELGQLEWSTVAISDSGNSIAVGTWGGPLVITADGGAYKWRCIHKYRQ